MNNNQLYEAITQGQQHDFTPRIGSSQRFLIKTLISLRNLVHNNLDPIAGSTFRETGINDLKHQNYSPENLNTRRVYVVHALDGSSSRAAIQELVAREHPLLVYNAAFSALLATPGRATLVYTLEKNGMTHLYTFSTKAPNSEYYTAVIGVLPALLNLLPTPELTTVPQLAEYANALRTANYDEVLTVWSAYPNLQAVAKVLEEQKRFEKLNALSRIEIRSTHIEQLTQAVEIGRRRENEFFDNYMTAQRQLQEAQLNLFRATCVEEEASFTGFIEHIKRYIDRVDVIKLRSSTQFDIRLIAPVNFDENLVKTALESVRDNNVKQWVKHPLGKAVFQDKTHSFLLAGLLRIDLNDKRVDAIKEGGILVNNRYIYNPHINDYACLGTSRSAIQDAIRRNDWVMLVEQLFYTVGNINISDIGPMNQLNRYLTETILRQDPVQTVLIYNKTTRQTQTVKEFIDETNKAAVNNSNAGPGASSNGASEGTTEPTEGQGQPEQTVNIEPGHATADDAAWDTI